jgi:hypothetical protein
MKFDWEYSGATARLSETREDSLSGSPVTQALASPPTTGLLGTSVRLRMVKHGPRYTTYYSQDGAHFMRVYEAGASLSNVKAGLFRLQWPCDGQRPASRVRFVPGAQQWADRRARAAGDQIVSTQRQSTAL